MSLHPSIRVSRQLNRSRRFGRRHLTLWLLLLFVIFAVSGIANKRSLKVSSAARDTQPVSTAKESSAAAAPAKSSNVVAGPALGNYPDTTVNLGGDPAVTPDSAPSDVTSINVSTSTNFKGTFAADPSTGVVRVTNAHPLGTYTVRIRAFDSGGIDIIKTFTLTVQVGSACAGAPISFNPIGSFLGTSGNGLPNNGAVATGDFNKDGKQDIAAANYRSNTVSIGLGDGASSFTVMPDVSVGSGPESVAIGDFNNDGKQDIAVTNFGGSTVSIRFGDGFGTFTGTTNLNVGTNPFSVAIGDFNNDGKRDLAVSYRQSNDGPGQVAIRLGDGLGGFTVKPDVSVGSSPMQVVIGDFNKDGKQDLAVANFNPNVSIRFGDGSGGFSKGPDVSTDFNPSSLAIGDFNNDGRQDIVTANFGENTASIRLGNGAGGFTGTTHLSVAVRRTGIGTNIGAVSVAIGDFNNDGKQDFVVGGAEPGKLSIRLGDGLGGFGDTIYASADLLGPSPGSLAIGDFNNDGKQDIAFALVDTVAILLGQCSPPLIAAATNLSPQQGSTSNSLIASAINDRVNVSVVSANPSNGVTISNIVNTGGSVIADVIATCDATNATFTLQSSDGSSTETTPLFLRVRANPAPTLVYFKPPAVAFRGSLKMLPATVRDNGTIAGYAVQSAVPPLTTAPTVDASGVVSITDAQPAGSHVITIRAFDNCGLTTDAQFTLDVSPLTGPTLGNYANATVNLGGQVTVSPDTAPSTATPLTISSSTNFKGTLAADPATGVVRVTNAHPAGTYVVTIMASTGSVIVNQIFTLTVQVGTSCAGDATYFADAVHSGVSSSAGLSSSTDTGSVAIGDFNNDGKQDIAASNGTLNTVSIGLGDGAGGFTVRPDVSVGPGPVSVAIGDFNHDGKQDIAVANVGSNTVSIRLGDGLGGFTARADVTVASSPRSVAVGDLNNDGKQDLVVANYGSDGFSLRLGDGSGGFPGTASFWWGEGKPFSVAVGDFNNDGNQDIAGGTLFTYPIRPNESRNCIAIFCGYDSGTHFSVTSAGVSSASSIALGDFNEDGYPDIASTSFDSSKVSIRLGGIDPYGYGNAVFSPKPDVSVRAVGPDYAVVSVVIGDFNNDGKQDIATANRSSQTVSIRLGDGLGGFSGTTDLSVGSAPGALAIGDFNNDGKQDIAIASHPVSILLGTCNPPPTIAPATGLSQQQGSAPSNSQIASITDDGGNNKVSMTITSANPSNGVTISNIVNTGGNVTADIAASCSATNATFTLQASDGVSTATSSLNISVTANSAPALVYPSQQSVAFGGSLRVTPTTASDNGTITGYAVQSVVPPLTTAPTVDVNGVVSITQAQPVGAHTITIRTTDNCGAFTDASFSLMDDPASQISFSQTNYTVDEDAEFVTIAVNRTGDLSVPVTVDYATDDTGAPIRCDMLNSGMASARCDFGVTLGTLKLAANETQKSFEVPITEDAYAGGPETFTVKLANAIGDSVALGTPSSAMVTINDSTAPAPNPIDDTDAFVCMQYHDFLNREPDPEGRAFWIDNIDKCNDPARRLAGLTVAQCIEVMRINTSAAFFLSIEFQQTGLLVRSFYVAALDRPLTNNMPAFAEFERDTQAVQRGVIVRQGNWQQTLSDNRDAFIKDFVSRTEFVGLYPVTDTPAQYVDKLYLHAGITPESAERDKAMAEFGSGTTAADAGARGRALLDITQNATFQNREMNRALVQIEYFGYLRRNPNDPPDGNFDGYNFWLNILDKYSAAHQQAEVLPSGEYRFWPINLERYNVNFTQAEMIKAFLSSDEYRRRFGP